MTTTNATNRANTGDLRATGAGLLALGTPIAAMGAWAWVQGPTLDAVIVIACGIAIAAFGILQVALPGALLGEGEPRGTGRSPLGASRHHGASTHGDALLHVA